MDRQRVYNTEGVILRRRNLGEADSIFTVFTEREGKFDAVARGVRKARSRMRGHLEPMTRTRMLLARGRSLDVFTQAETVSAYRALREDMERTAEALYCLELVDRFTVEHSETPGLYDLLVAILESLDAGAPAHIVRFFELHLLSLTGYEVHLDACAGCGARLPAEDAMLSPQAGGLVCYSCRGTAGAGRLVSVRAIKVLRFAGQGGLAAFAAVRVDEHLAAELQSAMAEVVRYQLERDPVTNRYLADVARLPPKATHANSPSPAQSGAGEPEPIEWPDNSPSPVLPGKEERGLGG